jgi:hypothetical protein
MTCFAEPAEEKVGDGTGRAVVDGDSDVEMGKGEEVVVP